MAGKEVPWQNNDICHDDPCLFQIEDYLPLMEMEAAEEMTDLDDIIEEDEIIKINWQDLLKEEGKPL